MKEKIKTLLSRAFFGIEKCVKMCVSKIYTKINDRVFLSKFKMRV